MNYTSELFCDAIEIRFMIAKNVRDTPHNTPVTSLHNAGCQFSPGL